jgi:c-di-GMP-binding flagellar brake protein YcgR
MDKESSKRNRKQERIVCNLDVVIDGSLICKAFDISEGGLFVYTDHCINTGSVVNVSLVSGTEKMEIKARVKHLQQGVGMGLRFIDLDDALKTKIQKLIHGLQGLK